MVRVKNEVGVLESLVLFHFAQFLQWAVIHGLNIEHLY